MGTNTGKTHADNWDYTGDLNDDLIGPDVQKIDALLKLKFHEQFS